MNKKEIEEILELEIDTAGMRDAIVTLAKYIMFLEGRIDALQHWMATHHYESLPQNIEQGGLNGNTNRR